MASYVNLIEAAKAVRKNSYSPYSGYAVGAAILGDTGEIWTGCNVENVSYGLCVCAERSAVARMVSEGCTNFVAVAVATADGGYPCGMCLQTLLEFCDDPNSITVITSSESGEEGQRSLAELIPFGFTSAVLKRT